VNEIVYDAQPVGIQVGFGLFYEEDARLVRQVEKGAQREKDEKSVGQLRADEIAGFGFFFDAYTDLVRFTQLRRENTFDVRNGAANLLFDALEMIGMIFFEMMKDSGEVFSCMVKEIRVLDIRGLFDEVRDESIPFDLGQILSHIAYPLLRVVPRVALSHLRHLGLSRLYISYGKQYFALYFVECFLLYEILVSSNLAKNQSVIVIYAIDFERYLNVKVLFVGVRIVFFSSAEGLAERKRPWAECVAEWA
jgi:hypothetical protein